MTTEQLQSHTFSTTTPGWLSMFTLETCPACGCDCQGFDARSVKLSQERGAALGLDIRSATLPELGFCEETGDLLCDNCA
tara:strand:- start:677 stop:916 length:240 start_codon:yes stop_codon:yes gene_type:complete